jgi:hypothetical protein
MEEGKVILTEVEDISDPGVPGTGSHQNGTESGRNQFNPKEPLPPLRKPPWKLSYQK